MRGRETNRWETHHFHLADLLSRKDVKEGFDRKPTTIVVRKIELKGNDWRYTDGR